jgi:hypothetical protein
MQTLVDASEETAMMPPSVWAAPGRHYGVAGCSRRSSSSRTCDEESLQRVEGADSLESAKERVEELAKFWPGKYVIVNQETGERLTIAAGDEPTMH